MFDKKTWTNDWGTFVNGVADLFAQGLDDRTVAARFAGKGVVWTGKVTKKRFSADFHGVQMAMPAISVSLPDGRHTVVDYLFLTLKESDVLSWRDVNVGKTLRFATQISQSLGPFPSIRWADTGDGSKGVIMFSTDGAVPVEK